MVPTSNTKYFIPASLLRSEGFMPVFYVTENRTQERKRTIENLTSEIPFGQQHSSLVGLSYIVP